MHELGVTRDIARIVVQRAQEHGAHRVVAVDLVIGAMRNLEEEWVQRYFDRCVCGTLAEGAQVRIEYVPFAFLCADCGETFALDVHKDERMHCPACGGVDFSMICGGELLIKQIVLE